MSHTHTRPVNGASRPAAATVDRVAHLVRMLASNRDGERTATIAAIERTLTGAGFDWAALASWAAAGARAEGASCPPPRPPEPDLAAMVADLAGLNPSPLLENQADFVEYARRALATGVQLTPKQRKWARDLWLMHCERADGR